MPTVSDYLSLPYTRLLKRDEEGDFLASILELPGCRAHGSTALEALDNLNEAQTAWIEQVLESGEDVPMPEPDEDLPSGKFLTRVPKSLHQKLNRLAKADDASLNQLVNVAIAEYVASRETQLAMWRNGERVRWLADRRNASHYLHTRKQLSYGSEVVDKEDPHFGAAAKAGSGKPKR